jgi:hypothetical protein
LDPRVPAASIIEDRMPPTDGREGGLEVAVVRHDGHIDALLERVRRTWRDQPDQRLGQLVGNVARWPNSEEQTERSVRTAWSVLSKFEASWVAKVARDVE